MSFPLFLLYKVRCYSVGKQISNPEQQVSYLKDRLQMFLEVLETIEPETTELEDIDRLIQMMDDLELKMEQFKNTKE
ncbi:hypothetical protein FG384_12910 [Psychrobacillus vulpis]|uniref:Uncharacterized protein n=1 Tax=Psychrobacillus vulpis TaxID=2325572 RepID=A0A544TPE6_9BACI|nr:hypothetical protein FG384_12910 [Psychrobacillus vulpis]